MKVLSYTDLLNYGMAVSSENLTESEAIVLAALLAKRDGFTLSMGANRRLQESHAAAIGTRLPSSATKI